jgi:hypothetical protein
VVLEALSATVRLARNMCTACGAAVSLRGEVEVEGCTNRDVTGGDVNLQQQGIPESTQVDVIRVMKSDTAQFTEATCAM